MLGSREASPVGKLQAQLELFNGGAENGDEVVEAALGLLIAIAQGEDMRQTAWLLSLVRERFRKEGAGA